MSELLVIRHGQASFGQDNYDVLSDLGHAQSQAVGALLRQVGWVPDRLVTGTLKRQRDTMSSMGFTQAPEEHAGFNEYDFGDLLQARFKGDVPELVKGDRKTHFRALRETVFEWQDAAFDGASETYAEFIMRVDAARRFACDTKAKRVLVVSSGGVIGQMTAMALGADKRHMMELNLQVKNTAMTRFMFSGGRFGLHEFNATPHFMTPSGAELLSYS
ncbi:histidine phosphatase family protein [Sulfitobacter sp. M57]|uniref:histidine phosphatase family protein n=1 Tax=unclassified Sulfitobacter TaxID=196795 RepID=UPI0023E307CC|nr:MULTISPECIES: histidine phosphatase family protein [unclassified Sulfitobacter]MDF3416498.1 histidine phosphatase family protein [Sulfitobacter sp. KE5]MDF3423947.1 histidine phosphatase family protein [Sulfitobacter sp. KE43]MDF3435048.1 histidine phosphatase family protein [Sulfitobacter sp. KE42]MDF3460633.1 histidine phosphatase family protein [Sulfitobacter sp. S74]MDF3464587.1 histidine phosphatase family protein [Sulfitobacter sp. Ks18]